MSHSDLLPMIVFALFVASSVSVFAAFKVYRDSRRQQSSKSLTIVICAVMAILLAFGAVWAVLSQPHWR